MSFLKKTSQVKLIMSLISNKIEIIDEYIINLYKIYGKIDFISEILNFDYTKYYEKEMGFFLKRKIISFEKLIKPQFLPKIKNNCINIEYLKSIFNNHSIKRKINIDPGYINGHQLILATGKPYSHRPYLSKGVYADITLIFYNGSFQTLNWTYPDYAGFSLIKIFNFIRKNYLRNIKQSIVKNN